MPPYDATSSTDAVSIKNIDIDIATHETNGDSDIVCSIQAFPCCGPISSSRQRNVRFSENSKVYPVLSRDEYTLSERNSCWYTRRDVQKSSAQRSKILARIENGKPCKTRHHHREMTYRGLETWTRSGADQVRLKYLEVVDVVLSEQFRQRQLKLHQPDKIASQCFASTIWSTLRAIEIGKADDKEAQEIARRGVMPSWTHATKGTPVLVRTTSGRNSRWSFKLLQRTSW